MRQVLDGNQAWPTIPILAGVSQLVGCSTDESTKEQSGNRGIPAIDMIFSDNKLIICYSFAVTARMEEK